MLKKRITTGVLFLAFFTPTILFMPAWVLVALLCVVYFLAQLEYCEICEAGGYKLERIGIFTCGFLFLGATLWERGIFYQFLPTEKICEHWTHFLAYPHKPVEILFFFIPAFLMIQNILRRKTEKAAECLGLSILGVWYVAVLMSFMVRIVFLETFMGRWLFIFFILLVKMGDTGAYMFGSLWGHKIKRRLIPEISPAKSIPGLVGAYVGSLLVSVAGLFVGVPWFICVALALLMATVGVLGDLAESLLKRSFGVKDSSKRFPGMGGFLDVIDSLLLAAPFMYFFLMLLS
ncbi:MAG: phosphatidate cytidylyltransferase [Kiritimatiellaeota bacterium]|nr:phosphatidate cytidylyltransferase [Kiritimatiellota bacterium]